MRPAGGLPLPEATSWPQAKQLWVALMANDQFLYHDHAVAPPMTTTTFTTITTTTNDEHHDEDDDDDNVSSLSSRRR